MTPERWEQIGELYLAAQEMEAAQRSGFLAQACANDTELRREVESLLQAEAEAGDFIDQPLLADALAADTIKQPPLPERDIIGHYQLQMRLGTGGMGEVYLARDTKLGRQVAIKLLPSQSARDEQARKRLLREARAAAALTHPNIVTIYAIEETADAVFIVMEYVKGETLAARIKHGALTLSNVLSVGVQVAEALAAAHAVGLIHRDIKPANVMLTPEGRARLLDFGIARMTQHWRQREGETLVQLTEEGTVIGTVAYMSPEQVRGEPLDARSDIFSFGALLYEAATGKPPFTGSNTLATMHAIATKEPEAPSAINPQLPARFDQILQRALTKDKTERYSSAAEFAAALRALQSSETEPLAQTTVATTLESTPVALSNRSIIIGRKTIIASVAVVSLVIAALTFAAYRLWERSRNANDASTAVTETRLTNTGNIGNGRAAISPDGKYVAYVVLDTQETSSLWLRQLGAASNAPILPAAEVEYGGLTFSRDSNHIYYPAREKGADNYTLYRIPLLGGTPQKILADMPNPISFSPDGQRFVYRRSFPGRSGSALYIANADGSGEQQIAWLNPPEFFWDPAWSPDGQVIACSAGHADGGRNRYVVEVSVGDWKMKPISTQKWRWAGPIEWLPDSQGFLLIASESPVEPYRVWRLSYPGGEAKRLTANTTTYNRLSLTANADALLTTQIKLNTSLWMVPSDAPQQAKKMTFGAGGFRTNLCWLPNGKIVFDSDTTGGLDISVMNEDGSQAKQLLGELTGRAAAVSPTVSPDGRYVVFSFDLTGTRHLWRMDFNGGNLVQLTNGSGEDLPDVSADGQWVIYTDIGSNKQTLWKVPIDGGTPVQLVEHYSRYPAVSPDGKWVSCFYSDESQRPQWRLAVLPIEGGTPVKTFPQPAYSGHPPKWTPDGRAITYTDERQSDIWLQPINGGEPRKLTDFTNEMIFGFEWSPDGKRLACVRGIWERNLVLIKNIR
jgi:serine/threonine protein kinase